MKPSRYECLRCNHVFVSRKKRTRCRKCHSVRVRVYPTVEDGGYTISKTVAVTK
jgi:Zn finger protein HypA/HybF involved in hydrogenase expression